MFTKRLYTFRLSFQPPGIRNALLFPVGILIFGLLLMSCPTSPHLANHTIQVQTDQRHYAADDSLTVSITNDSTAAFPLWLYCGTYPDLFYQQQVEGAWSETQPFWYVFSLCPSQGHTLLMQETYQVQFHADWFEGSGTFRFVLKDYYSASFTIE